MCCLFVLLLILGDGDQAGLLVREPPLPLPGREFSAGAASDLGREATHKTQATEGRLRRSRLQPDAGRKGGGGRLISRQELRSTEHRAERRDVLRAEHRDVHRVLSLLGRVVTSGRPGGEKERNLFHPSSQRAARRGHELSLLAEARVRVELRANLFAQARRGKN